MRRPGVELDDFARSELVNTVVGNLEVILLPYDAWRRVTPQPIGVQSPGPIAIDYEGVEPRVSGIRMHVQLSYEARAGKIGDTTMRVTMQGPAGPS